MSHSKLIDVKHLKKQQGLSLVELMIAMVLGLFLIWGVTQSFLTSRHVYAMQQGLSRIQENSRMVQEFIAYDIRNAGDYGCSSGDAFIRGAADARNDMTCGTGTGPYVGTPGINMVKAITSVDDEYQFAVYGYDDVVDGDLEIGASAVGSLDPVPKVGTDVLVVHVAQEIGVLGTAIGPPPTLVQTIASPPGANSIVLAADAALQGVAAGSPVLTTTDRISVSDCATTKIFAVNAAVNAGDTDIPVTVGVDDNYCTASAFQTGASVRKVFTVYYYVAANLNGGFSLYRARGNKDVTGQAAEELLENVEDFQLTFGVDNDGTGDGVIDEYKTANTPGDALDTATEVTDAEWNGWDWVDEVSPTADHIDYNLVRAVRYSLLMSAGNENLLADPQVLDFNGVTLTGGVVAPATGDNRLRQVITSTVAIRSRSK